MWLLWPALEYPFLDLVGCCSNIGPYLVLKLAGAHDCYELQLILVNPLLLHLALVTDRSAA